MLQVFRDDSLPDDVVCLLAAECDDMVMVVNGRHVDKDVAKVREACNAVLAEVGTQPQLRAVG